MKYEYRATMVGGATVRFYSEKKPRQIIDEKNRILMTEDTIINIDQLSYMLVRETKDRDDE